jgi:hypothetical protein
MSPRWLHWPAGAAAPTPDYTISGTFDGGSGTGGAIDNDALSAPTLNITSVIMRGSSGQNRINITFDSDSPDADDFLAAVPNGSTAVLTYGGTEYTAASIGWIDLGSILRLDGNTGLGDQDFPAFPTAFTSGTSYVLEFYA